MFKFVPSSNIMINCCGVVIENAKRRHNQPTLPQQRFPWFPNRDLLNSKYDIGAETCVITKNDHHGLAGTIINSLGFSYMQLQLSFTPNSPSEAVPSMFGILSFGLFVPLCPLLNVTNFVYTTAGVKCMTNLVLQSIGFRLSERIVLLLIFFSSAFRLQSRLKGVLLTSFLCMSMIRQLCRSILLCYIESAIVEFVLITVLFITIGNIWRHRASKTCRVSSWFTSLFRANLICTDCITFS